jgi:anti-sigma regulatory factor (Ser/Thr protein kinase)
VAAPGEQAGYPYWDGVSELSLADVLRPPAVFCIEAGASGKFIANWQRRRAGRTLGLLVTARSAFGRPIAKVFVAALAQRLSLCPGQKDHIHTALHEALGNAVLHGNLGVGSRLFDSSAGLEATRRMIDSRLASDDLGLSSIRLDASWTTTFLYVAVRDSGSGFQPARGQRPPDDASCSGRGLFILHALCDRVRHFAGGTGVMLGFVL